VTQRRARWRSWSSRRCEPSVSRPRAEPPPSRPKAAQWVSPSFPRRREPSDLRPNDTGAPASDSNTLGQALRGGADIGQAGTAWRPGRITRAPWRAAWPRAADAPCCNATIAPRDGGRCGRRAPVALPARGRRSMLGARPGEEQRERRPRRFPCRRRFMCPFRSP
jgi:hypothetical protein